MADPTPTARGTPGGIPLRDGFSTKITLALDTDIEFREITVKPPGIDGGDTIDFTDMHNTTYRTMRPRSLKTLTECTCSAHFDPICYTNCLAACNREDTITITFPDGSTLAFYGYLRSFEPDDFAEGEPATCTIAVQPTNWDATNSVEASPYLTNVAGT